MEKASAGRTAMSGTALLTTSQNGKPVTVPVVMLVQWPNLLRIEVQDPVGALLMLLVVNEDRFWSYQKNRPEIITGPLKLMPTAAKLPLPNNARDITRAFLARPDWEAYRGQPVNENHELRRKVKFGDEVVTYDPKELTPESLRDERFDGSVATVTYEEFSAEGGVRYPTKIRIRTQPDERSLFLVWKDWQPTVAKEKKLFQIPQEQAFGKPTKALR